MDWAVIRIRYRDFSVESHNLAGLHGNAERGTHGVTLYLLPGLSLRQRRAVLRRLRQEASRGFGPALPLPQLLLALGADRVRVAVKLTAAVIRLHPAETLLPTVVVAAAMALFVMASAGGQLGRQAPAAYAGSLAGAGRGIAGAPAGGPSGPTVTAIAPGGRELGSGTAATSAARRPPHARRTCPAAVPAVASPGGRHSACSPPEHAATR